MTAGSFEQVMVTTGAPNPLALVVVITAAMAATYILTRLAR